MKLFNKIIKFDKIIDRHKGNNSGKISQLNQISKETISKYQMSLLTQDKPLSLETQYVRLVPVKSFFRYLAKTNQVLYDPASDLELPRRKKNLPKDIMTKKEVFKLLNQPNPDTPLGLRDKAILEVLYSSGIRRAELCNLDLYDINLKDKTLYIRQPKNRRDRIADRREGQGGNREVFFSCASQIDQISSRKGSILKPVWLKD